MSCPTADLIAGLRERAQRLEARALAVRCNAQYADDARAYTADLDHALRLAGDANVLHTAAALLERDV